MATQQSTVDELLDRVADAGAVTARKMFGEYCLYLDGKPIALVCDDALFVKPTPAGEAIAPDAERAPPYPGAKPHLMLPIDAWHDGERLCRLLRATFDELSRRPAKRKRK